MNRTAFGAIVALVLLNAPNVIAGEAISPRAPESVCIDPGTINSTLARSNPSATEPKQFKSSVAAALSQVDVATESAICVPWLGQPFVGVQLGGRAAVQEGDQNQVLATLSTSSPVGSKVTVTTKVLGRNAACTLEDEGGSGAMGVGDNEYVLLPGPLHDGIALMLSGGSPTVAGHHLTDFGGTLPGSKLWLDLQASGTRTDPFNIGVCDVYVTVVEEFPVVVPPVDFLFSFDVLPKVGIPIAMGSVQTTGGWSEVDTAVMRQPAPPLQVAAAIEDSVTLTFAGLMSHTDGQDYEDRGEFWYTIDGGTGDATALHDDEIAAPFMGYAIVSAGSPEAPAVHTICLHARYVDGGLWESNEGEAETCTQVSVVRTPSAEAADGLLAKVNKLLKR
ncbi:MAG: hypothetical protein AABX89_05910 [Candidatus Thermoplasmatota archaeon]